MDIVSWPWWMLGQFKERETAPWSILRCLMMVEFSHILTERAIRHP
jgi:hypothetical protein